jgi:Domain of unknown function (DUF4296)
MTRVLIDLYLAEAKTLQTKPSGDTAAQVYTLFREQVFKKHSLDTAIFNRSIQWYTNHADVLDQVYNDVVDSLALRSEVANWD